MSKPKRPRYMYAERKRIRSRIKALMSDPNHKTRDQILKTLNAEGFKSADGSPLTYSALNTQMYHVRDAMGVRGRRLKRSQKPTLDEPQISPTGSDAEVLLDLVLTSNLSASRKIDVIRNLRGVK